VTIPETIYYWDGVVLISDQRIMLGHWLYDPADVRRAEVTKVEDRRPRKKVYIPIILLPLLGTMGVTILDLGLWDPFTRLVFVIVVSLFIGVLALSVLVYMRRVRLGKVFVNTLPDFYLLKIHKRKGVGSDYVYLEKSYLEKVAELINDTLPGQVQSSGAKSPFANLHNASVYVPPIPVGPGQNSFYFDGLVDIGPQLSRFGNHHYKTSEIEAITAQPVLPYASSVLPLLFGMGIFIQSLASYLNRVWPKTFDFGPYPYILMMGLSLLYLLWGINSYRTYYLINVRGSFGTHSVYITANQLYADTIVQTTQAAIASQPGWFEPSAAATNS
jgi:hypothetical protein